MFWCLQVQKARRLCFLFVEFGFFPGSAPLKTPRRTVSTTHICDLFFFSILGPSNHHSQSTLRPPLPPPHNHSLSHHHSSANSLNRNSLTNRRNQIHAPAPAPTDLATTPESVQLQDSWVLNSNVPLETRWVAWTDTLGGWHCTVPWSAQSRSAP